MGDNQADSHRRGNDTSRSWQFGPACLRLLFLICLALLCLLLTDSGNREAEAQTGYDTHFLVTGNDQPGRSGKTYFYSDLDQEINLSLLVMNVASTNQTVELNGTAPEGFILQPITSIRISLARGNSTGEGTGFDQGYAAISTWKLALDNGSPPDIFRDYQVNFTLQTVELNGTPMPEIGPYNLTRVVRYEPVNLTHSIEAWDGHVEVFPRLPFPLSYLQGYGNISFNNSCNIDVSFSLELLVDGNRTEHIEPRTDHLELSGHSVHHREVLEIRAPHSAPAGNYSATWLLNLTHLGGKPYNGTPIEHGLNFTLEVIHAGTSGIEFETRWRSGMRPKQEEWFTIPVRLTNHGNAADNFTLSFDHELLEPLGFRFVDPVRYVSLEVGESKLISFRVYAPPRSTQGNDYDLHFKVTSNTTGHEMTRWFWLFIDFRNPEPLDHVRDFAGENSSWLALGLMVVVVSVVVLLGASGKSS